MGKHKLVKAVNVEPVAAATSLAWNGSMVGTVVATKVEERKARGSTE